MRGLTTTILLVLVLAGLGAYIYFVDSKRPAGGVEEKQKVFTVAADKIQEMTVTSAGETTTLRKQDGAWKITAPVTADADSTEVSNVTNAIAALEVNRVVDENAQNLADFGLAEPAIKVAYKAEGSSGEVHLGSKTPTQSDMYAVKAGEKRVFLVQAYQESSLAKKTFDFRDKRVLNFERDKVDAIELSQGGSAPITLARSGTDWNLKQPIATRSDYTAVEGLLTRLSTASMTKLVDPNSPEDFGLEKPSVVVTLGAGSTRATLEFGAEREGAIYARDRARQLLFTVDPSLVTEVKKTADDFRVSILQRRAAAPDARHGHVRVPEGQGHRRQRHGQVAACRLRACDRRRHGEYGGLPRQARGPARAVVQLDEQHLSQRHTRARGRRQL